MVLKTQQNKPDKERTMPLCCLRIAVCCVLMYDHPGGSAVWGSVSAWDRTRKPETDFWYSENSLALGANNLNPSLALTVNISLTFINTLDLSGPSLLHTWCDSILDLIIKQNVTSCMSMPCQAWARNNLQCDNVCSHSYLLVDFNLCIMKD